MVNYKKGERFKDILVYQPTVTKEELEEIGFRLFGYNFQVNGTTVQFVGSYETHEVYAMFRPNDSATIKILPSGRTTEECGSNDKPSFLKNCFGKAYGEYITRQIVYGATMAGENFDLQDTMNFEGSRF